MALQTSFRFAVLCLLWSSSSCLAPFKKRKSFSVQISSTTADQNHETIDGRSEEFFESATDGFDEDILNGKGDDFFESATTEGFDESILDPKLADLLRQHDELFGADGRISSKVDQNFRCGYVSIVGAPNMGKSTLMNALLNEDLCVATRRPQTTRHAILGVITTDDRQLLLVDTPGVIENPAYKLQEGMMEAVMGAFHSADVNLVVTDLFSTPIRDDHLWAKVRDSPKPTIVVVNKVDLVDKINPFSAENEEEGRTITVEEAVAKWRYLLPEAFCILPVVASEGIDQVGVQALLKILLGGEDVPAALRDLGRPIAGMFREGVKTIKDEEAQKILPLGPPLYEEDALTDRSERFFSSEIIRGALFRKFKKELPYCCEVRIDSFREPREHDRKKLIRMEATILVERESQKQIVVGTNGEAIKSVGIDARKHLEEFLQNHVFLKLNVKVDKDWRKNEDRLKQFGYMR